MTTKEFENDDASQNSLGQLEANLEKLEELTQRLVKVMGHKREVPSALQGPGQELYMKAATAYMAEMMHNPTKIFEHQIGYWGKTLQHYMEAQQNMLQAGMGEEVAPPAKSKDRRFSDPMWDTHPYFHFLKQQYMLNAEAVDTAVADIEGLDEKEKKRLEYFSRQIVDLMSPTNFLGTNPEALQRAVETEGQSLVDGLENLVRDLEANDGDLVVTLADKDAFQVGENIGTTKGKGTAGVMKRHGFHGVGASHGAHRNHRKPGSIGACATPGRVFKGLRMSGRMGSVRHTTQGLKVHAVDAERGLLLIKGAVPGPKGGLVFIRTTSKAVSS